MKSFLIVDKTTNNVTSIITWGNDMDLPLDYPINQNEYVLTFDDEDLYNRYQNEFEKGKRFKVKNPDGMLFEDILEELLSEELPQEPSEIEKLKQENIEIKLAMAEMFELMMGGGVV